MENLKMLPGELAHGVQWSEYDKPRRITPDVSQNTKMKTTLVRSIVIVAAFALSALSSRADKTSYAQVIKERDAILSQILAQREAARAGGIADEESIATAQRALYSFRRDVVSTITEKIKNQELIVKTYEKKLAEMKARASTGLGDNFDVLVATDCFLQAKQVIEELKLNEK